jgi:hypothetical protein
MANNIGNIRKKCHETFELISTSMHEAGHTIYGLLHFINVGPVLVFQDKKSKRIHGLTLYDTLKLSEINDPVLFNYRLYSEIGLSYSGLVSEKHHFKLSSGSDKLPMFLKEGCGQDLSEATALFNKYNLSEPGAKRAKHKRKIIKSIETELNEHWGDVCLVAHFLFKKNKISALELRKLLLKKSENKEFWKENFKIHDQLYNNSQTLDEINIKSILSL